MPGRINTLGSAIATGEGGSETGGTLNRDSIVANSSGTVTAGESGVVAYHGLQPGPNLSSKFRVYQCHLLLADGQPAPNNLDLIIIKLDGNGGATKEATLIEGDGSTIFDDVFGQPQGEYEQSSGSNTAGVVVDNGDFNSGTGADQEVAVGCIGEVITN